MVSEVEHLREALAKISLAERDTTTAAADKVRDMARIAREALRYPYNAQRIAWELERTAMGDGFHGNALRAAKDIPGLTDEDRALLDRYATGRNSGTDHVALQDLALRIDRTAGVGVVQPPSQQDIAEALLQWPYRTGSSVCPLCGHDTPHDHTPREITIYRNGVKWGQRNGTEPWPGKDHQGVEKDGQDDAGPTGSACWVGADQHHQHRARQPDPDGADHQRHSGRDGLSGGSEVPSEVTDRAPAAVGINGLTEAETSATASVMGIAGVIPSEGTSTKGCPDA